MKRLAVSLLAMSLVVGMTACGGKNTDNPENQNNQNQVVENGQNQDIADNNTGNSTADIVDDSAAADEAPVENTAPAGELQSTVGEMIKEDFRQILADDPTLGAEAIAAKICENPALVINPVAMPVEEGFLSGFDNTEITGFIEGATFGPMISTLPFVGYVFVLAEDADADAFVKNLEDNGNLNWNICTSADEMVVDRVDNTVLFVMCPTSFEQ